MPAHDLVELFGFESQIESAAVAALEALSVPACRQRGQTTLNTPRVEVKLHMGVPTGHRRPLTGASLSPAQTVPDAWHAQLLFTTITNRKTVVDNAERHDELVGKSRLVTLQGFGTLNALLTYLTIDKIDDAGVIPRVMEDSDLDVSPLLFNIRFSVRPDAWPVEITG